MPHISHWEVSLNEHGYHKPEYVLILSREAADYLDTFPFSLNQVPEGIYFLTSFPLKIKRASESPACPVLFTKEELKF